MKSQPLGARQRSPMASVVRSETALKNHGCRYSFAPE